MHVIHLIANCSSVPYFNQFADRIGKYPEVKFSFVALYKERPQMLDDMKQRGCDCYWIKFDPDKRKRGMISAFFSLYRLFRKLKPDVVNTHLFDDSLPGLLAAKLAGVKIRAIHKQDTGFHLHFAPKWVWADKVNNSNATQIIAPSRESAQFAIDKEGAPAKKVYVVHSGIDIDAITRQSEADKQMLMAKYGLENKLVIGTIARLIEWKGYRYIIEAIKLLGSEADKLKFVFIGVGTQEAELKTLVEKYGLQDKVVFTGWVDRKYIPSLFGLMEIYLHVSTLEPFGFAVTEAMANEVPVVINQSGGAGDVLEHKRTCYFVEGKNPKSIADGIRWMLDNSAEREAMKEEVKKIAVEEFSVDKMLDGFLKVYQS